MENLLCMKVAVVGMGSAGLRHLRAIRSLQHVQPIAVPKRAGQLGRFQADGTMAVSHIDEAVSIGANRAIVASETRYHAEDALAALRKGLDVLVEKPMATDSAEAVSLCRQAQNLGRSIYVGCTLRFSESLNLFKAQLHRVGPIHAVRIECQSYLPQWRPDRSYRETYSARAEDGGVLRDLIHEIDYAGWIFGWPIEVQARLRNLGRLKIDSEELAELSWELSGGGILSICLDYLSRPARRRMRVHGEYGTLEWDGMTQRTVFYDLEEKEEQWNSSQTRDAMFSAQAEAFLNATDVSLDPRLATGIEGAWALAICDAARLASIHRRQEKVLYP